MTVHQRRAHFSDLGYQFLLLTCCTLIFLCLQTLGMKRENIFVKSFPHKFSVYQQNGYFVFVTMHIPCILADWDSLLLQPTVCFLRLIFFASMTSPNTFIKSKTSKYHCSFFAFSFFFFFQVPVIACGGEDNRLHIFTEKDNNLKVKKKQQYE